MSFFSLNTFYVVGGCIMLVNAGCVAADKGHGSRWTTALFWTLLGTCFVFGASMPFVVVGYMVLGMGVLAVGGKIEKSRERTTSREERTESAKRLGNWLFVPALIVPVMAVLGTLIFPHLHWRGYSLVDPAYLSITSVFIGAALALVVGMWLTRAPVRAPVVEGSRLLQAIGWALILPQALAALGGLFAHAGVGEYVASIVETTLPTQYPSVAVAAYCLGMFLFTICMGNAFAAFAVMTGGIGVPFIVHAHGGNPAIMAAIGMLAGYCGTLVTPMAANFNLVPVMLLELEDKNAVIKAQAPMALALLAFNLLLMEFCVYRF